jgi:hypothetical protein
MGLSDDSLLMPFRKMAGTAAPGMDLGGWYEYLPDYDYRHGDAGLAPGATFGQWVSALARMYAVTGEEALRERVIRLNGLLGETISTRYFAANRFPAYCFDKLVCGLMDSARLARDPGAYATLEVVMDKAMPELPGHAVDREVMWRRPSALVGLARSDVSWSWDESYTLPENLYLVSEQIQTKRDQFRYRSMAEAYLDDATYFDPLARGEDVLAGKHAYSYVNALCSAMQAYLVGGSGKHLLAARNGFDLLEKQSFCTGGWGPDEQLRKQGDDGVFASLTASHNSFEAPCGSYAHMKLTRYLLRATRDGRYGDSMERVLYNAVLGVLPLKPDGEAFYYADYGDGARRVYSTHRWPCCSGTLPQVVSDYGVNAYLVERRGTEAGGRVGGVWVNLFVPSTVRFEAGGAEISLVQDGGYPADGRVRVRVTASKPVAFDLRLRIPAWAAGARLRVNGSAVPLGVVDGFATVSRTWRSGDGVEMEVPMELRLEPLDARHSRVAALMCGPRVLFPLGPGPIACRASQALAAQRVREAEWQMESANGPVRLVPFTGIGDAAYSTYLRVT